MRLRLLLQHECHRLWLAPGARITCRRGRLWLTMETRRPRGASPDIVLEAGGQHAVQAAGHYFLAHLGPEATVECEVAPAPARPAPWWRALRRAAPMAGGAVLSAEPPPARWT